MRTNPSMLPDVLTAMQESQQAIATAIQQLSSGKRVELPSDDPTASAAMVKSLIDSANTDQYTKNAASAKAEIEQADSALSTIMTSLNQAVTIATQGATGTLRPSDRQQLATEAQGVLDTIVSQANTTFQGKSIFGGTANSGVVFTVDPTSSSGFMYLGNSGINLVPVGGSLQVPVNLPGDQIFLESGKGVLGSLTDLVIQLKTGSTAGVSNALASISSAISFVGQQRILYANATSQLAAQESYLSQETISLTSQQTSLVGLDTATAITSLTQAQVRHSAVLAAVAKIFPNTLLDYLK